MMKKYLSLLFLFLFLHSEVFAQDDEKIPLRTPNGWFVQPAKGQKTHDSNLKIMLWRADKWRTSETWRYYPHVTSRYYRDCSFYKYVNCDDLRYSACWQCKDYLYNFELKN